MPPNRYMRILRGKAEPRFVAAQQSGFLAKQAEKLIKSKKCKLCAKDHKPTIAKMKISNSTDETFRNALVLTFSSRGTKTPNQVAVALAKAHAKGKKTLIIQGDVGHGLPALIETLSKLEVRPAIVMIADPIYSATAARIFNKIIDVFTIMMRWTDPDCAEHFGATNYVSMTQAATKLASGEIIIRIPVKPGHIECDAKSALQWISENQPSAHVQLILSHKPHASEHAPELSRGLSITDMNNLVEFAQNLGIETESIVA